MKTGIVSRFFDLNQIKKTSNVFLASILTSSFKAFQMLLKSLVIMRHIGRLLGFTIWKSRLFTEVSDRCQFVTYRIKLSVNLLCQIRPINYSFKSRHSL